MYIYKLLDDLIEKYFQKRLMPGVAALVEKLNQKYGSGEEKETKEGEKTYEIRTFGFQTLFILLIMLVVFLVLCVVLLILAVTIGDGNFDGLLIFVVFSCLCLVLCVVARLQSGYAVYTSEWIYIEQPLKKHAFSWKDVKEMKVTGDLTFVYLNEEGKKTKARMPIEGRQYLDFMKFLESNCPDLVATIPSTVYEKAKRKHGSAWGNQM